MFNFATLEAIYVCKYEMNLKWKSDRFYSKLFQSWQQGRPDGAKKIM